ncbi:oligosaccharide flippase family protein [Actinoplanes sp. NPDC051851]|uniref:oligosaccharide flippase family protein n=1 Tax=Actinoplanes sp. NPDC051851 TaxID=3154753 RepID=UPI00343BBA27
MTTPTTGGMAGKVRRALAWSTLNNLVVRLGSFGVSILLARLLAPSEFGVFAVALTVQTVLVALAELGFSADLIRHGDIERRAGTATTVATGFSALMALGMCAVAGPVSAALGSADATAVVQVMSATLVLSGISVVPYAMIQRDFRQSAQMSLDTMSVVVNGVVAVALISLGFGAMALAVARVVSQGAACVLQFVLARTRPRFGFDRAVAEGLIRFGVPLAGGNLLSWIVMTADYAIVGRSLGAVALGFYTMAFNISTWPMGALGAAVRAVALPAFSRLTDPVRRGRVLVSAVALSWVGALLAGILLSGLAKPLIAVVYGERWLPAAAALAGLGLFGGVRVVTDLMSAFLTAAGRTRLVLITQALWLVALVPAMIAGARLWGLEGAGWAHLAVAAVVVLPFFVAVVRSSQVPVPALLGRLAVPVLAAVPAALLGMLVERSVGNDFLALLAGGLTTTVVFLAPLAPWVLRRLREVRDTGPAVDHSEELTAVSPA